ncbi:MAG: hypothetical protein AAF525_23110 [Pseudomonadota bacterium]
MQADLGAANAEYDFIADLLTVDRAIGYFPFLNSESDNQIEVKKLREHLQNP